MCVVVHVVVCLARLHGAGWGVGVGWVITSLPTVRSGYVRHVSEVYMCVVGGGCCLPCQVARGGWGVGGVITSLPTVRSGHVRYVFEVYMCVVDALPAGFTGGCIGVSRCINACDNC